MLPQFRFRTLQFRKERLEAVQSCQERLENSGLRFNAITKQTKPHESTSNAFFVTAKKGKTV